MRAIPLFVLLCACGSAAPQGEPLPAFGQNEEEIRGRCRVPAAGDDWGWRKLGAVRGLDDSVDVLAPAVLVRDGLLHLWFARKAGLRHTIHHAISRDAGTTFSGE